MNDRQKILQELEIVVKNLQQLYPRQLKTERKRAVRSLEKAVKDKSSKLAQVQKTFTKTDIGSIFTYVYDPKMKDVLSYYDIFPIVLIIDGTNPEYTGYNFLGLNFHYLPPVLRGTFLKQLLSYKKEDKLAVTYPILKAVNKLKMFHPTIKRYLFSHIKSGLIKIDEKNWRDLILLPTQQFQKKTDVEVWKESRGMF